MSRTTLSGILDALCDHLFQYGYWFNSEKIGQVARSLVTKFPAAKDTISPDGAHKWIASLQIKLAGERHKLRKCPDAVIDTPSLAAVIIINLYIHCFLWYFMMS